MTLESFQRQARGDGFRYSLGYRTKRMADEHGVLRDYEVQRWNGEGWEYVGSAANYAGAREVAGADIDKRVAAAEAVRAQAREDRRRSQRVHVCRDYTIRDGKTVCVYCGEEMEL